MDRFYWFIITIVLIPLLLGSVAFLNLLCPIIVIKKNTRCVFT